MKLPTPHCCSLVAGLFLCLGFSQAAAQEEDLAVIQQWLRYADAPNALYHHLSGQAFRLLDEREAAIARLKTRKQWQARQARVRAVLQDIVGPFPDKTPLNPRVTGTLQKDGYRMEKVVYESMPGFYVTAALFIPDGLKGKAPAILYCSGHTQEAFRGAVYQTVILNLVKKGFVVLAFDPVGQGERQQYYDPQTGDSRIGRATREHSYSGAQCFISGSSQARYVIWDGIRSIDYLLTRPEVDPRRIGITGRSGGGTQSAYIAAFDDRILAAAPENYITSFRRLMESIAPQDAEQNFYHGLAGGIDHADLLEVRAPRPALIIATTRDFFSIQGVRETFAEVARAYKALGQPENVALVEDDAEHASTPRNREAMYAFFRQHLNLPGPTADEQVELLTPEELQVTPTGQVATSFQGQTVASLNSAATRPLLEDLDRSRQKVKRHLAAVRKASRQLSGLVEPQDAGDVVFTGRFLRAGYAVEKYFMPGEGDYIIPFLVMVPSGGGKHPALIYLHPAGKAAEAGPGGELEWFVKQGYVVLAPDLIGLGEMGDGKLRGDSTIGGASYDIWFSSILIGRSLVGLRAGDFLRTFHALRERPDVDTGNIVAVARGDMAPVLLHAAAIEPEISRVALIEPLASYQSLVMNTYYQSSFVLSSVAGALTAYDLPDLAASLAPRPLLLINVTDHMGQRAGPAVLEAEMAVVRSAYAAAKGEERLEIRTWEPGQSREEAFSSWLGK